jgi:hypothetical protein
MRKTLKAIIKRPFKYILIVILPILFIVVFNEWNAFKFINAILTFGSENRNYYSRYESFMDESRIRFIEFHKNKNKFYELSNLVVNESHLHVYAHFRLLTMPLNYFIRGVGRMIINDYLSNGLFFNRYFYSLDRKRRVTYKELLISNGIDRVNIKKIDSIMHKLAIEVIHHYPEYIELCWDSPVDDEGLDSFEGYLLIRDTQVFENIRDDYRYLSRIDDKCYYFLKDVK